LTELRLALFPLIAITFGLIFRLAISLIEPFNVALDEDLDQNVDDRANKDQNAHGGTIPDNTGLFIAFFNVHWAESFDHSVALDADTKKRHEHTGGQPDIAFISVPLLFGLRFKL